MTREKTVMRTKRTATIVTVLVALTGCLTLVVFRNLQSAQARETLCPSKRENMRGSCCNLVWG